MELFYRLPLAATVCKGQQRRGNYVNFLILPFQPPSPVKSQQMKWLISFLILHPWCSTKTWQVTIIYFAFSEQTSDRKLGMWSGKVPSTGALHIVGAEVVCLRALISNLLCNQLSSWLKSWWGALYTMFLRYPMMIPTYSLCSVLSTLLRIYGSVCHTRIDSLSRSRPIDASSLLWWWLYHMSVWPTATLSEEEEQASGSGKQMVSEKPLMP